MNFFNRLFGSSVVDTRILQISNKFTSIKCYMIFWRNTICRDISINKNLNQPVTFLQNRTLLMNCIIIQLREVSKDNLQRRIWFMCANGRCFIICTPGSRELWDLHVLWCWDQAPHILFFLPDLELWTQHISELFVVKCTNDWYDFNWTSMRTPQGGIWSCNLWKPQNLNLSRCRSVVLAPCGCRHMTSSGKNGLNIRTNASPKWDRTMCLEE